MDDFLSQRRARSGQSRTPTSLKTYLWVGLASFAVGAILIGYLAWRANPDLFFIAEPNAVEQPAETETEGDPAALPETDPDTDPAPEPTPEATATQAAEEAAEAVERVAEQQGGFEQRLTAAEQRLARLDLQSQAAAGNAARAEGLLIAFATRRSLSRGAELGYLADQLRLRFGDALPNAVDTVITFSRDPILLDELVARLDGMTPELVEASNEPPMQRLQRELSELFVIRRETTPSPQPVRRLERARFFLESGRVNRAIEEVRNTPGAASAEDWIRDAERYAAAHRALDLIETSAVLEPRRLRDRTGTRIEQPSPAGASANEGASN